MRACTRVNVYTINSCTRLLNYTIGAFLKSVSVSVPWNSSFTQQVLYIRGPFTLRTDELNVNGVIDYSGHAPNISVHDRPRRYVNANSFIHFSVVDQQMQARNE